MIGNTKNTCSRLRHRLTLQQKVDTADGAGGYTKTWSDIVDLWAEIIPMTGADSALNKGGGKKILFGGQVQSEISHKILLRYRDGVTAAMRLVYEDRIFNIRYVADTQESRETLVILAQEGVAT